MKSFRLICLLMVMSVFSSVTAAVAENFNVRVFTNAFSPSNLTIQVGDSVTWTNEGGLHNVETTSGANFRCANGCDDSGGNGAASGALWTFTRTFNSQAEIDYVCIVHAAQGMTGSLTVEAGGTSDPGQIRLTRTNTTINEDAGNVNITAERTGGTDGSVGVSYATSDGSAQAPGDYTAANGTLSWTDGEGGTKSFAVAIVDDPDDEPRETLNVAISAPSGGAGLDSPSTATITIRASDGPVGGPGVISFTAAEYEANEDVGDAQITAQRSGDSVGAVSVDYATSDGSAEDGSDYTGASGTLDWADGDTADKSFPVSVVDDAEEESDETVNLALSNPGGGVGLGGPSSATLMIRDNDATFPPCVPDEFTLCLNEGGRFQVQIDFDPPNAPADRARVLDIGKRDSGLAYFFNEDNVEMLIKVLNGCGLIDRYWVFFAATTNVEFTLTVTDTEADIVKTYTNPQGQSADAVTDTDAFATCP